MWMVVNVAYVNGLLRPICFHTYMLVSFNQSPSSCCGKVSSSHRAVALGVKLRFSESFVRAAAAVRHTANRKREKKKSSRSLQQQQVLSHQLISNAFLWIAPRNQSGRRSREDWMEPLFLQRAAALWVVVIPTKRSHCLAGGGCNLVCARYCQEDKDTSEGDLYHDTSAMLIWNAPVWPPSGSMLDLLYFCEE